VCLRSIASKFRYCENEAWDKEPRGRGGERERMGGKREKGGVREKGRGKREGEGKERREEEINSI